MKTAVLICPGRGTYNKAELGTLARHFPDADMLARFDAYRESENQETLSALDGAGRFSNAKHGRGDNVSGLIFAAGFGDFLSLSSEVEIVAVTGNSMGWYTTLACGGAVSPEDGFAITTTMGRMMHESGEGGQLIYPHMDADWKFDADDKITLLAKVAEIGSRPNHALGMSIDLGGMLVLAGNESGLSAFASEVPQSARFPMRLPGHAGFHSPLVAAVSEAALGHFPVELLRQPGIPLVDGRGQIWWPHASDPAALRDYTFGHQVTAPYDFTRAVSVAAREFAPDIFIVVGPGTTLGGAVAQSLITVNWQGMSSKSDFQSRQDTDPILISMGREDQRALVSKGR